MQLHGSDRKGTVQVQRLKGIVEILIVDNSLKRNGSTRNAECRENGREGISQDIQKECNYSWILLSSKEVGEAKRDSRLSQRPLWKPNRVSEATSDALSKSNE